MVWVMNEDTIRSHIKRVIENINTQRGDIKLGFSQQKKKTKNMSIVGGNGRLRIKPTVAGFDISLAGKSLEREMYPFMSQLFGRNHDGYKQRNKNKGTKSAPFWKTNDLSKLELAAVKYSKTIAYKRM